MESKIRPTRRSTNIRIIGCVLMIPVFFILSVAPGGYLFKSKPGPHPIHEAIYKPLKWAAKATGTHELLDRYEKWGISLAGPAPAEPAAP